MVIRTEGGSSDDSARHHAQPSRPPPTSSPLLNLACVPATRAYYVTIFIVLSCNKMARREQCHSSPRPRALQSVGGRTAPPTTVLRLRRSSTRGCSVTSASC